MNIFRNLTISRKLHILIMVSVLSLVGIGSVGYSYVKSTAEKSNAMYEDRVKPAEWIGVILRNSTMMDASLLELMLTTDLKQKQEIMSRMGKIVNEINQTIQKLENSHLTPQEKKVLQAYTSSLKELRVVTPLVVDPAKQNKNAEAYKQYNQQIKERRDNINQYLDELKLLNEKETKKINEQNNEALNKATILMISTILASLILSISIGMIISRGIVNPINDIKRLLAQAEKGDFTVKGKYQSKDEVGDLTTSFNDMIKGLHRVIRKMSETSQQVAASSEELSASAQQSSQASEHISTSIQELAAGADDQVHSIAESTQVMKEMVSYTEQIAENAKIASETVYETADKSREGEEAVQKVTEQMGTINANVQGLSNVVAGLNERSNEIGKMNDVITDIAAQTNLLALNAAIEAARAGEQGRGFSVVADEVRKLAEQSANSAEQISQLINIIHSDNDQALESMKSTTHEVEEGLQIVREAGDSFKQIKDSVKEVVAQIEHIALTVKQLSEGTSAVSQAISSVNETAENAAASTQTISAATEEQLASMEEISTSSTALAKMAEQLQDLVIKFKV
ncbi:methyl-accepting chemotaxis protein [Bacillaceae bacterium SAOS 7]|nr:methyl-accepting chemotaxis protein [Bacillaceae bacterium SAOS 7]